MNEHSSLPRFVTAFPDRHGRTRYRFRRKGYRSHYFVARLGTASFREEYEQCLRGEKPPSRYELSKPDRRRRSTHLNDIVYFIGAADGPVKIGVSHNVSKRLATLQTAHPVQLFVLATAGGGIAAERHYHAWFAGHLLRGEWFERSPELVAEIDRLNAVMSNRNAGGV